MRSTIKLNDFEMYYEKIGQGNPLLMLHGNGEDSSKLARLGKKLSKYFTVYLIDSRGHGKSLCDVKEFDYVTMALDIKEFITLKKLNNVSIYGFSDGGIIALYCAMFFPQLLKGIMVSGVNINPKGLKLYYKMALKIKMWFSKNEKDKMLTKLMLTKPNIKFDDLKKIKLPVFLTAANHDLISKKHTMQIIKSIEKIDYIIVKKANHSNYVINNDTLYAPLMRFARTNNLINK